MSFAKNLRTERKKLGLSAEELAKLVGVSRSYITLLESGRRSPTKTIVAKIAKGLKIILRQGFDGELSRTAQDNAERSRSIESWVIEEWFLEEQLEAPTT